jgi:hypothetical protein
MTATRPKQPRNTAVALLSALACLALMLEQARLPIHLALHEHCFSHWSSDCDEGHEHEHQLGATHFDLHHPEGTSEEHCPNSVADHLGELPQQFPKAPSDYDGTALALCSFAHDPVALQPRDATLTAPRLLRPPPPPRPTAPRGPPSLV